MNHLRDSMNSREWKLGFEKGKRLMWVKGKEEERNP